MHTPDLDDVFFAFTGNPTTEKATTGKPTTEKVTTEKGAAR